MSYTCHAKGTNNRKKGRRILLTPPLPVRNVPRPDVVEGLQDTDPPYFLIKLMLEFLKFAITENELRNHKQDQ